MRWEEVNSGWFSYSSKAPWTVTYWECYRSRWICVWIPQSDSRLTHPGISRFKMHAALAMFVCPLSCFFPIRNIEAIFREELKRTTRGGTGTRNAHSSFYYFGVELCRWLDLRPPGTMRRRLAPSFNITPLDHRQLEGCFPLSRNVIPSSNIRN